MSTTSSSTWQQSWNATPGPRSPKEYALLFLKGLCMGTADIIPGVSGGTIAFITGIYQHLLAAIESFRLQTLILLIKFQYKEALSQVHLRFLLPLFLGIVIAIISTARLMHFLLASYSAQTWSLFFGLILASIWILSKKATELSLFPRILWLGLGTFLSYWIVGLIPISTPETHSFIFFCGLIAICAMILPGLSGAFLLLILGKYEFVTAALKNPFLTENIVVILVFVSGCIVGLLSFSRVLSYLLDRFPQETIIFLTGLMIGALRKVWPWKEVLETKVIREKVYVLAEQNILPTQLDASVLISIALMLVGFALVLMLSRFSESSSYHNESN